MEVDKRSVVATSYVAVAVATATPNFWMLKSRNHFWEVGMYDLPDIRIILSGVGTGIALSESRTRFPFPRLVFRELHKPGAREIKDQNFVGICNRSCSWWKSESKPVCQMIQIRSLYAYPHVAADENRKSTREKEEYLWLKAHSLLYSRIKSNRSSGESLTFASSDPARRDSASSLFWWWRETIFSSIVPLVMRR